MGFEDFESLFGEPKVEWSLAANKPTSVRPFLFRVHAMDSSRLRVQVTDFFSNSWEAVRSIQQLEDMRDNIGIGGSWSEFMEYLMTSIRSSDVKLVLEGQSKSDGPASARLIAQKSKGMPLISISLVRLVDAAASETMASLSLDLYRTYKSSQNLLVNEQEGRCQLTKMLSAEQEKNEDIQKQLDVLLYSKRHKSQKIHDKMTSDTSSATTFDHVSDKQSSQNPSSMKAPSSVVPAYRRAKVRGVLLEDTEDVVDD